MPVKVETYLDSNAGAPLRPRVKEALLSFLNQPDSILPNPSSIHAHGRLAKRILSEARERVASSLGIGIDSEQILFTSSGSEANQLVVRSVFEPLFQQGKTPEWITTTVEHDSNLQMAKWVEEKGGKVHLIPVNSQGELQIDKLAEMIHSHTALVSCVWANNETGVISDILSIQTILRQNASETNNRKIPLHLDAIQAWGKFPLQLQTQVAEYVTLSGHKIGGLAGAAAIWIARGHSVKPVLLGKQEKGRRGGTENLFGIFAMGVAASLLDPLAWNQRVQPLRDRLQNAICDRIQGTRVNGGNAPRVGNTINLSFEGIEGDGLVMALDLAGFSVSSGSACSSGVLEPSHVLMAMGCTKTQAMAAVRISLADELPWPVLEEFILALEKSVSRMRGASRREQSTVS